MKKKKFTPKYARVKNPVLMAIENAAVITPMRNAEYRASEAVAIRNLATGQFGPNEWTVLVDIANMAEIMSKDGIGIEVIPVAAEAQVVLAQIRKRFADTGTWTSRPDEVFVMRELQEYHDLQRQSVAYGQYLAYAKKVANYVKGGNGQTFNQILEKVHEAEASL